MAAAIIEHALDFDGRYGVHISPGAAARMPANPSSSNCGRGGVALGAFRPGQIAAATFAVLCAKFLLIDEIEGGDLARCDLSEAATSAAFGRPMGDLVVSR